MKKMSIKKERIELQRLALLIELHEDDARTIPSPVLLNLRNLLRDINVKALGKPHG